MVVVVVGDLRVELLAVAAAAEAVDCDCDCDCGCAEEFCCCIIIIIITMNHSDKSFVLGFTLLQNLGFG